MLKIDFKKYTNESDAEENSRDFTSLGNPILLVLLFLCIRGFNTDFILLITLILLMELIGNTIKVVFFRARPNGQTFRTLKEKIYAGSFPSLHTARSMLVFYACMSVSDSNLKYLFLIFPVLVGLTRVILKKHFVIDVVGGIILGIIAGLVFAYLR